MSRGNASIWRLAARMFLLPVFAWLLAAQSIMLPLAKAQAASLAGGDSALSILCSSTLPPVGDANEDSAPRQVHDLGCCTLASRADLDLPVATLAAPLPLVASTQAEQQVIYLLPQERAPPAVTATPSAARAPPIHT